MTHPLVLQLRFTRNEFRRGLEGVTDDEARRRLMPMNCISWIVGHLAWQEQRYWLTRAQGKIVVPDLNDLTGYGKPASTPPLDQMWTAWRTVTEAADPYLESLTSELLTTHMMVNGKQHPESIGSMLRRVTYHYWYHTGEAQAIRQMLGHTNLPEFVGDIHDEAPYVPENPSA
jgi:uncharacterized damage-inducible protein DinB